MNQSRTAHKHSAVSKLVSLGLILLTLCAMWVEPNVVKDVNSETTPEEESAECILERLEEQAMRAEGMTSKHIALAKQQKVHKEQVSLYSFIERKQYGNWLIEEERLRIREEEEEVMVDAEESEQDVEGEWVSPREIGLALGNALEALGRRELAIEALRRALRRCKHSALYLSLARLLFRDNQKDLAEKCILDFLGPLCMEHSSPHHDHKHENGVKRDQVSLSVNTGDIADAFYILGWISIHADDHTKVIETTPNKP